MGHTEPTIHAIVESFGNGSRAGAQVVEVRPQCLVFILGLKSFMPINRPPFERNRRFSTNTLIAQYNHRKLLLSLKSSEL